MGSILIYYFNVEYTELDEEGPYLVPANKYIFILRGKVGGTKYLARQKNRGCDALALWVLTAEWHLITIFVLAHKLLDRKYDNWSFFAKIFSFFRPNESWPSDGAIEFDNVTMRYREGLDPVLKCISCKISPMEKVGIVGRTGTLFCTFFHMRKFGVSPDSWWKFGIFVSSEQYKVQSYKSLA